jgi:hypothetical protein
MAPDALSPASASGRLATAWPRPSRCFAWSNFGLFRHLQGVIDLDPEVSNGALQLRMAYLYAAIGFSILIEMFNQISRWRRKKNLQGERTIRERTAHAVLRLMGGRHVGADEVGEEISDMLGEQSVDAVFGRRERVMISGVLQLAERPVRTVMTVRTDIDHIDLGDNGCFWPAPAHSQRRQPAQYAPVATCSYRPGRSGFIISPDRENIGSYLLIPDGVPPPKKR